MDNKSKPFLSDDSDQDSTDTNDSQAAANLARAKLQSLYEPGSAPVSDSAPIPQEPSTPSTPQPTHQPTFETFTIPRGNTPAPAPPTPQTLYAREEKLQHDIDPTHTPVARPDHELPAARAQYELPVATAPTSSVKRPAAKPSLRSLDINRKSAIAQYVDKNQLDAPSRKRGWKFWKSTAGKTPRKKSPFFRTALITALVLALYNQQVISGQINYYISPGEAVVSPQIIDPTTSNEVSEDPFVIIPKINVKVPTVYGVETRDDSVIQEYLEKGVVHYDRTAVPGQVGNTVILGHSSNSFWNGGQHKNAFSLLDRLDIGDTYMINYKGKQYVYEIFNKEVIDPTEFRVVSQDTNGVPISTLITCTPPGTSWKRLVIQAEQISPDPAEAKKAEIIDPQEEQEILAGNTDSLWDNVRQWLFE